MSITIPENFYKETIAQDWPTGTGNFYVSTKPTKTAGWLVISPSSSTLREIVAYTAVGTDGTGDYVTVSERGVGGTTEQTHVIGETIRMNITAENMQEISDALDQIVAAGAQDATEEVKGIAKLPRIETTAGATHSLTTNGTEKVIVWAKGWKEVGGVENITLKYDGVTKDTVSIGQGYYTDRHAFTLMFTEVLPAGTANLVVSSGSDVVIVVLKI